ncbi:uncharacterized protein LOC131845351 [Achroia grisella]|uniref:uncharacterized protein LOC131845351 n=1 Tax=Achroia grisella TaxID=688607 RepID=UPI0027D2A5C9|nr:uncharacterized protein LOC131845351 [Achroia grisella]XP_059050385.1 uncharacterized protein LOC131845351 [Achroia grisella]
MVDKTIYLLFVFTITTRVQAQFYDIFSELRPQFYYQTSRSTTNPIQEERTTKSPKYAYNHRNDNSNTTTQEKRGQNTKPSAVASNADTHRDRQVTRDKPKRRIVTAVPVFNFNFVTTSKPAKRTTKATTKMVSTTVANVREDYRMGNVGSGNPSVGSRTRWQDNADNFIADQYTPSPNFDTTNYYNRYTTYNPLYNVPGVRPALVDSYGPPITNKPATKRPLAVFPRPTDGSVIRFPEGPDTSPPMLTGPDEDSMSNVEKRRYIEVSERMCDKYKSRSVTNLQAIPLLPSPDPVQFNVTQCAPPVPLVVGGKAVSIREFPHMVLLGWTKTVGGGYSWKCGGSLLSDKFVLTAGHCAYQNKDNSVVTGGPRVVQMGSTYLDDTGALVVKVAAVYRHPKYTQAQSYYDTALLKLARTVTFSEVIQPACLGVPPAVGEHVVATGWGRTEYGGDQSLELRGVSIPIWDMEDCRRILGVTRKLPQGPLSESQICAGERKGGKDTCQGDSGGPAQIKDGCVWRVVAVTSVGRSCGAANTPALYARVHRAFIAAVVFGELATTQQNDEKINNYDRNHQDNDNKRYDNYDNNNYDRNKEQNSYNNNKYNNYEGASQSNYDNNAQQNNYDRNKQQNNNGYNRYNNYETTSQSYYNNNRQQNNYDRNKQQNNNENNRYNNYESSSQSYYDNNRQQNNYNVNNENYDNYGSNNRNSNNNRDQSTSYDRNNRQNYNSNANSNYEPNYENSDDSYGQNSYRVNDFSRPTTNSYRYDTYGNANSDSRDNNHRSDYNNRQREQYRVSDDSPNNEDIIYWPDSKK